MRKFNPKRGRGRPRHDDQKNPGGRPTKFRPAFIQQAKELAMRAFTDAEIADFFDVNRSTLYRWAQENKKFCNALSEGTDARNTRVERSVLERAIGYTHDDVHVSAYQGAVTLTPIKKHYPPDPVAAKFWLVNRNAARWKERVEIGGDPDAPLIPELTPREAARRIAFALALGLQQLPQEPSDEAGDGVSASG